MRLFLVVTIDEAITGGSILFLHLQKVWRLVATLLKAAIKDPGSLSLLFCHPCVDFILIVASCCGILF